MKMRKEVIENVKVRWWATRLKIFHRKINRRKYYGVKKLIEEYKEELKNLFEPFLEDVKNLIPENPQEKNFLKSLIAKLGKVTISADKTMAITKLLINAYLKGSRRVFTRVGVTIKTEDIKNIEPIKALHKDQLKYISNIEEEAKKKILDELTEGLREGKSIFEIRKSIIKKVEGIVESRAETIARSEIIKASAEGTRQSMIQAGIKEYIWLSARDNRVCEICRKLDGKIFKVEEAIMPVKDTHPNCRCSLVANI